MNQNNLYTYSSENDFFTQYKKIIKCGIITASIILFVLVVLVIFINKTFPLIIGYLIGAIVSYVLLFVTNKMYINAYYGDFGKVTKRVHWIHQITYAVLFILSMLIYLNAFLLIGLVCGLLLVKCSSLIISLKKEK